MSDKPFEPTWHGPLEGWTINFSKDNIWRVQPVFDLEDLYQQGFLIFLKCKKKYGSVVDPQHFMALYKTSFTNYIHDMSKKRTGEMEVKEDRLSALKSKLLDLPKDLTEIDEEM